MKPLFASLCAALTGAVVSPAAAQTDAPAVSLVAPVPAPAPAPASAPAPVPAPSSDTSPTTAPNNAPENTLPMVVVTATRSATALSDAPAAVTVTTRQEIDNRNVSRISDALQKVPSLYLGRAENGQVQSFEGGFSLRGMDTRRTLILLDGLQPLQNANSQGVNWLTVFTDDVERVEVVPGAFASLYGSNAMGGVINVISKRADTNELTLRLKRGFGDAAGTDGSVYARTRFANGLGLAAGLSHADREGYVSELTVRTPVTGTPGTVVDGAVPTTTREGLPAFVVGDRGRQPWRQTHAMAKLSYELSPQDRVTAGLAWTEAKQGWTRFNTYLTDAASGDAVSSGTLSIDGQRVTLSEANFQGSTPLIESSRRVFAGYEGQLADDVRLKIDASRISREFKFPTVGAASTFDAGPGNLSSSPNQGVDATATLSFPLGAQHAVVTGLSLHRDTVQRSSYALTNWRDLESRTTLNNGYDGRSTTSSIFVQDEFIASQRLTLYAGGRVDRWQTEGSFFQNTAPVSSQAYPRRGETSFNPKLSGVFKPVVDVSLRASWGRSFRAPSNLDLYSTTVQSSTVSPTGLLTIQSDPNLKPERGESWEAGGEWRAMPTLKLTGALYRTELDDLIYSRQVDLSLTQRINAGKARVHGVEAGIAAKPVPWLEINTNASLIDSEILDNSADPGSVGKRMTQVPRKLAYLGLTAMQGDWTGLIEARYSGQTFITARNTDTVQGVPTSNDAYTNVNLKLGWRATRETRVNLSVNNLLDKTVYQFSRMPGRNATLELVLSL
jgi:iron complex outermembrane receptor protein